MAEKCYQHLVQILPLAEDSDYDGISDDIENAVACLEPDDDDSDDALYGSNKTCDEPPEDIWDPKNLDQGAKRA